MCVVKCHSGIPQANLNLPKRAIIPWIERISNMAIFLLEMRAMMGIGWHPRLVSSFLFEKGLVWVKQFKIAIFALCCFVPHLGPFSALPEVNVAPLRSTCPHGWLCIFAYITFLASLVPDLIYSVTKTPIKAVRRSDWSSIAQFRPPRKIRREYHDNCR